MKRQRLVTVSVVVMLLLFVLGTVTQSQGPLPSADNEATYAMDGAELTANLGNSMTYQGRLVSGGSPANGTFDFQFKVYDVASGGTALTTVSVNDLSVTNGLFAAELTFSNVDSIFYGRALWIEILVRPGASTGSYTTLSPRQKVNAVPYAFSLYPDANVFGSVANGNVVWLRNTATSGLSYGIRAETDSASGYGGYFRNYASGGAAIMADGSIVSTAETEIAVSPLKMVQPAGSNVTLVPHTNGYITIDPNSTGPQWVYVPVDVPSKLLGAPLKLKSVRVCYDLDNASSYITDTVVRYATDTGGFVDLISSTGNRTSTSWECYTITDTSPSAIQGAMMIRFVLTIANTSHRVYIGKITLTLVE